MQRVTFFLRSCHIFIYLEYIAAEGQVKNISGGKFVHKYRLPSTSSVVSAVKGLLEKDFITQNDNVYSIYDRFFQLWIEKMLQS